MYAIGQILIEKLTKEELTDLCEAHDHRCIADIFYNDLYPKDEENYPEKYVSCDDEDMVA